jgi:hypothetical protein
MSHISIHPTIQFSLSAHIQALNVPYIGRRISFSLTSCNTKRNAIIEILIVRSSKSHVLNTNVTIVNAAVICTVVCE